MGRKMKKLITIFIMILSLSVFTFANEDNPFDIGCPVFSDKDVFIKSQKIICTGDHLSINYVISGKEKKRVSAVIDCKVLGFQRIVNDIVIPLDFCLKCDGKEIPFEVYKNNELVEKESYYSGLKNSSGQYWTTDKIEIRFNFELRGEKAITVSYENLKFHGMFANGIDVMLAKNPDGKPIDYTFIYKVDNDAKLDQRILYPHHINLIASDGYANENIKLNFVQKKEKDFSLQAELKQYNAESNNERIVISYYPMTIGVWGSPQNLFLSSDDYSLNLSEEKLPEDFLLFLSKAQLAYLRNAIYAFHGYKFKNKNYADLFAKEVWYKINPNFSENDFNEIERANITLIKKYEEK